MNRCQLQVRIISFYFESFDSDGVREYQNINLEADATSFIDFADGNIDLELEGFIGTKICGYGISSKRSIY